MDETYNSDNDSIPEPFDNFYNHSSIMINSKLFPYIEPELIVAQSNMPIIDIIENISSVFNDYPITEQSEPINIESEKMIEGNEEVKEKQVKDKSNLSKVNEENNVRNNNANSNSYITIQMIKEKLKSSKVNIEIINNIKEIAITSKDKESVGLFETKKKKTSIKNKKNNSENSKKLLGRKRKLGDSSGTHTKDSEDNLIKKIKGILFSRSIEYINSFIKKHKTNKKNIFKLRYLYYGKYVNDLKKENEMNLFETKLKDFASLQASEKYFKNTEFDENYNKNQIVSILEEEKNNEKINMLLNMTFGEFIDIFSLMKNLDDDLEFNGLQNTLKGIYEDENNSREYFSRFVFYLFNYKAWFNNKKGRKGRKEKKKLKDEEIKE